ncbi:MAG: CRISPR-associated protein [Bacteroidales bacterium]|jgi:hypothetical protein|nr:CRISPR-associated protein [Bacteroidales bacterium]
MLINLSNHPVALWQVAQLNAAVNYGEIVDLPFPDIDPAGDEAYIQLLCEEYLKKILQLAQGKKTIVHVMGEMTFTFYLVKALQERGIECIASTTSRIVTEPTINSKKVQFAFIKFRKYI